MPKYKKRWWKDVQKTGERDLFITIVKLKQYLNNCKYNYEKICLILLYYTGARPSELLDLRIKNFGFDRLCDSNKNLIDCVTVVLPTKKSGISRKIFIPIINENRDVLEHLTKFLQNYNNLTEMRLFPQRWSTVHSIKYAVKRATNNELAPYFFRHNRLSLLADDGANLYQLMHFKGAKTPNSVLPYLTLAGRDIRDISLKMK